MKIPEINYRAVAIIAIVVSVFGLVISPVSAAVSPSGTYIQGQHYGGNFLSNQTRIAAAAQTLGVSVSELTTALTPPSQGHFNLTNVAAQVSTASGTTITPTQLMTALGMHAGGMRNSTQWKQGSSFRSYHAGFGNLTAQHARYPARGQGS
jgi:hypothetical protein